MKKVYIILIALFLSNQTMAQSENKPWEIDCDNLQNQIELMRCTQDKYELVENMLSQQYDQLITKIDTRYKNIVKEQKNKNNSTLLDKLKEQKEAILQSKYDFKNLLKSTLKILELDKNEGINSYNVLTMAIELNINQLNILKKISEEISR